MNYTANPLAITVFLAFVGFVLGLSFYYARKTRSASGYFAAGGTIHWFVNGIAFAGDYLSAASFLGICGLIATMGYDGFLYSIGYLAGWIVALFVVAEPLKRLGKYTFADALDAKFNSKGIQLMAAISTLTVSLFYLIPQMVGAGVLVTPLLGLPHWMGVIMVGVIVITIVATAGMTSTTYVQFIKGASLIVFSTILTFVVLQKGLSTQPSDAAFYPERIATEALSDAPDSFPVLRRSVTPPDGTLTFGWIDQADGQGGWFIFRDDHWEQAQYKTDTEDGRILYNGAPKTDGQFKPAGYIHRLRDADGNEIERTGPLGVFSYFAAFGRAEIVRYPASHVAHFGDESGDRIYVFCPVITPGEDLLIPGQRVQMKDFYGKLNFISLMLALFLGTAALPHILIRYYTVPSSRDARKSTIVAISGIGFFYVLTLFMGLGAMTLGVIDVESSDMAAPLLARSFSLLLFAIISAVAFATVLGTVSGLIVAASGAVAHDVMANYMGIELTDTGKVKAGKVAAFAVGLIAILLGIAFEGMNVAFLVGWAFSVAASSNLPAIIMLLFWKKTTAKGIAWSIGVGMVSSLTIILTSPSMYTQYGLDRADALHQLDNPAIISIPLSFLTLYVASLLSRKKT